MMKTPKKTIFVVVLLGLLAGFAPRQVAASGGLRTVALSGQEAPGAGEGVVLKDPSTYPSMNSQGHVAYRSSVAGVGVETTNDSGLWVDMGNNSLLVAREGEIAPGTSGALFGSMSAININNLEGEAAFSAELSGAGVDESSDRGIWRVAADGAESLVVREGDPAPGAGAGVTFSGAYLAGLSDGGDLAFTGWLDGVGIDNTNDRGIWRQQAGGVPVLVAREGNAAPGVGNSVFGSSSFSVEANASGQIAFTSRVEGSGIDSANDYGVWSEGGGNGLALIAREGDEITVAGEGVLFRGFNSAKINNAGQTAFLAGLSGTGLGQFSEGGVFRAGNDGQLSLVARTSDPAPGVADAYFSSVYLNAQNDLGETVISGSLTGDDINSTNGWGIWSDAGGTGLELIARRGDAAPGTELGTVFVHFDAPQPRLNNEGRVALMAFAGPSREPGQPFHGGKYGLWAQDTSGELQLILQQWDLLDVSDDPANPDLRVISGLSLLDNQVVSDTSGVDGVEQLLLSIRFTDGSSGIFTSDLSPIPIPGDFDLDRDTDGADFLAWQRGESPVPLDAAELALWQQAFGGGQNLPANASAAVPEPNGLLLLGFGSLLLGCHRGRCVKTPK